MNMNRPQPQQLQQPLSSQAQQQQQQQLQQQQQQRPQLIKQQLPNIQYQQKQQQQPQQLDQQMQQQPFMPNPTHGVIDQSYLQQPQQQQQFQQGLPLKAPQGLDQQQQVNPAALPPQGQHLQGAAKITPNNIRTNNNVLPPQLQAARQNPLAQPQQPGTSSKMQIRKVIENQILIFKEQKSQVQKQGKVLDENKWKETAQRKLQSYHQDSLKTITQTKQPQKDDWIKLCNLPMEELLPQIIEMTAYHQQKTQEIEEKINSYKQKFRFLLEYGQKNPSADCQEQEQLQQPSSLNDSYEAILEETKAEFDRNQKDQLLQQGMLVQGQEYNQQGGQMGEFPDGYLGEGNQQGNYPGQMGVGEVMQVEDQFQSQYL